MSIELLTVRQLKELLANNFVDYKGCCEKAELVMRVRQLWTDHQRNVSYGQCCSISVLIDVAEWLCGCKVYQVETVFFKCL